MDIPSHCILALRRYKKSMQFTTVKDLLMDYFNDHNPATFYKNNSRQCMSCRRRSFYDLYSLALSTFPSLLIEDFAKELVQLIGCTTSRNHRICAIFCNDINKVVFYAFFTIGQRSGFATIECPEDKALNDCVYFKENCNKTGEDGLSFIHILKTANISKKKYLNIINYNYNK